MVITGFQVAAVAVLGHVGSKRVSVLPSTRLSVISLLSGDNGRADEVDS